MRSVTFVVSPPKESHPAYRLFDAEVGVTRERIHHLTVFEDGTMVLIGQLRGDIARAERLLADSEYILDCSVSPVDDASGLVYVRSRPPPAITTFLELPRSHEVFFDFPIEGTDDGDFRVTMVGETNERLQAALADLPSELEIDIERIGPPPVGSNDLSAILTDRQQEILDVALELGYYEVPRTTTHQEIADQLGLSVGTVGEHLQKIEARVFEYLA